MLYCLRYQAPENEIFHLELRRARHESAWNVGAEHRHQPFHLPDLGTYSLCVEHRLVVIDASWLVLKIFDLPEEPAAELS